MNIIIESRNELNRPERKCVINALDLWCNIYDNTNAHNSSIPNWYEIKSFDFKNFFVPYLEAVDDEEENYVFYAEDCGKAERIGFRFASCFIFNDLFVRNASVKAHRYKDGLLHNYKFALNEHNNIVCSHEVSNWNNDTCTWLPLDREMNKQISFMEFCKIVAEEPNLLYGWE